MSEEIKVGEFVRTQYGYIRKVKSITKFPDGDIHIYCGVSLYYRPREIRKHSNNIIDLIEVGDYVNGIVINGVDSTQDMCFNKFRSDMGFTVYSEFNNKDIETVVTKEQMREMEFNIKE